MIDQRTMHERMYEIHERAEAALDGATERVSGGFMTTSPIRFRVDLVTPTAEYAIAIQPEVATRAHYLPDSAWQARVYVDGHSPIDVRGDNVEQAVQAAVAAADETLAGAIA